MSKQSPIINKEQKDPHFISTYTRIALSEWKELTKVIRLHSKQIKELSIQEKSYDTAPNIIQKSAENEFTLNAEEEEDEEKSEFELSLEDDFAAEFSHEFAQEEVFTPALQETPNNELLPPLLTIKEIQIVMAGPYHNFIKMLFNAYGKIARLRYEKHLKKEDIYKGQRDELPPEVAIPDKTVDAVNFSKLNEAEKNLNEHTKQFHETWEEFFSSNIDHVLADLEKDNFRFTEYEIKELHDEEPMTELLSRFVELNLEAPKNSPDLKFVDYITLKVNLSLQSSLSRQHLPHDNENISKIIKKYKSEFNRIAKAEKKLFKEQYQAISKIINTLL